MKTYIVAHTHMAFDITIRDMKIHRPDAVRIRSIQDTRGLALQPGQVIYADGWNLIPDAEEIQHYLDMALERGTARSQDDQRTHRLTITDLLGNTIGTRLVTARQAKDALG